MRSDTPIPSQLPLPSSVPPPDASPKDPEAKAPSTATTPNAEQPVDEEELPEVQFEKPQLPVGLPVDFVDLYTVLALPRNADEAQLRQRIAELYLDAQKNLDHRNAKKRLHYQELSQVMLPQARHLLLDPERRKAYDQYLEDYQEDEDDRVQAAQALQQNTVLDEENALKAKKEKARIKKEESLTPEELEARRESLWEKWEENLATAQDSLSPVDVSRPGLQERAGMRKEFMEHALIEAQETERRRETENARRRIKERRDAEDAERRAKEEQAATRLHSEYVQNANRLIFTARFSWAFGLALTVVVTGFVLRRLLHIAINIAFSTYPLGGTENVDRLAIYLTALVAVYAAWKGAKFGKTTIEELVKNFASARREAEVNAIEIVRERFRRENPNARQHETDVAVRAETIEQLRQIYHLSTLAMTKRNATSYRTLGIGLGTFIVGSGIVLGIHATSRPEPKNIVFGLSMMVGLILTAIASVRLAEMSNKIGRNKSRS